MEAVIEAKQAFQPCQRYLLSITLNFMMLPFILCLLASCVLSADAAPGPKGNGNPEKQCSAVAFQVSATAENFLFADPPNPDNETAIVGFIAKALSTGVEISGTQTVSDTFTIHGVYCKPSKKSRKNRNALQLLSHGITYNSTMWSGYGFGDRYNWHAFANDEGYHTLAIDRLGYGLNSRDLDPLNTVQPALQVEIIHQLIGAIRKDAANNALDRGFKKIVHVGHSYGSMMATQLARLHPKDVDAIIQTGWSTTLDTKPMQAFTLKSVSAIFPSRFPANMTTGYVTTSSATQREQTFYFPGHYDPAIPVVDYASVDTVTVGEMAAFAYFAEPSLGYTNPLMVVTGVHDFSLCPEETQASCDAALNRTRLDQFPDVPTSKFAFYAPANTGHDLTLHYSANKTFEVVHRFLGKYF